MAVRNIITDEDPMLRKKSRAVENFDERLGILIDDMKETLFAAEGIGLAAVQVGVLRRVVIVDMGEYYAELVNPEIISEEGVQEEMEACLSLPNKCGVTRRPKTVKVKAQDRNGKWHIYKGEDLIARCFCHEIDHLNGILFTDRVVKTVDND